MYGRGISAVVSTLNYNTISEERPSTPVAATQELDIDRRGSKISFRRILSPKSSTFNFHLLVLSLNFHFRGGGGRGDQLLMSSPVMLKSQIPISAGGGGGGMAANFQKSTSKSQIPISAGGLGGGGPWNAWNLVLPPSMHLG